MFPSPSLLWGQQTRTEQLLHLQHQARHYASLNPHTRDLLLYVSAYLLWAYMEKLPAYQFKMALTQELSQINPSAYRSVQPQHSFSHMFAKKRAVSDADQLSLFPEEKAPVRPAPAKENDLSWLDQTDEALRPTQKPQTNSLFPELEQAAQPKKSYLSRRIEERYGHTNYFLKLTQEEREGLFQRLNQAAAINHKSGKAAAHKFLYDMSNKYPRAHILFLQAKHLLLGGILLLVADNMIDFCLENQSMNRLLRNPQLFLEASEQEIALLAQDPQAVPYAQLLVASLEEIAPVSVSDEELAYIRSSIRRTEQSAQNQSLRQTLSY